MSPVSATIQLCQSETAPLLSGRTLPCLNTATVVLFGVHLCRTHERVWKQRLQHGRKIRVHPERALPPVIPPSGVEVEVNRSEPPEAAVETKRCTTCGETKPLDGFYLTSAARGRRPMPECRVCFGKRTQENARKRQERGSVSVEMDRQGPVDPLAEAVPGADHRDRDGAGGRDGRADDRDVVLGDIPLADTRPSQTYLAKEVVREDRPAHPLSERGARPPDGDRLPPSAPADLSGLPVVPAGGEILPSVALASEAPAPLPVARESCATPGCTRPLPREPREGGRRLHWCLECQLEGKSGMVPMPRPALTDADRPGRYVYMVEFICLACSRFICNVKVASESAAIQLPPGLHCRACGGAPVRSGEVARQFAPAKPVEWPKSTRLETAS